MRSVGLFGYSQFTAKVAVSALAVGLLGTGIAGTTAPSPAIASTACSASAASTYTSGRGTVDNPYQIATSADLIRISTTPADWAGTYFSQTADIDLGSCEWTPIGRVAPDSPFSGFYDGGGFDISGLKITSRNLPHIGLFGYLNNSRVENFTLRGDISITGTSPSVFNVGSVAGAARDGTNVISKVRSEVSVLATTVTRTGGLVGELAGSVGTIIEYSSYVGSIRVDHTAGNGRAGGFVGSIGGLTTKITNSYVRASFSGTSLLKFGVGALFNQTPLTQNIYGASPGVDFAFSPPNGSSSTNSFWDSELAAGVAANSDGSAVVNAVGRSTDVMRSLNNYSSGANPWGIVDGWELFSTTGTPAKIWGICSAVNDGYPFLLWEYTTDPCVAPQSNSGSGSSGGFSAPPQATVTSSGTDLTVNLNKIRVLRLSGSNLNLVTQASVGGKNATINFGASDSGNLVISKLPLLPSGKYTLTLLTPTGLVAGEVEVVKVAKITRLRAIDASGKLNAQVRSVVRKQNLTYASAGTLRCWGVTTSSSASELALARQRAEAACAYAKKRNPDLDVVASARTGTGKPARNQVVKLRYLK